MICEVSWWFSVILKSRLVKENHQAITASIVYLTASRHACPLDDKNRLNFFMCAVC